MLAILMICAIAAAETKESVGRANPYYATTRPTDEDLKAIRMVLTGPKQKINSARDLVLAVSVHNSGKRVVYLIDKRSEFLEKNYTIEFTYPDESRPELTEVGRKLYDIPPMERYSLSVEEVKPNGVFGTQLKDVSRIYDLSRPGRCKIRVTRYFGWVGTQAQFAISSNEIEVEIAK